MNKMYIMYLLFSISVILRGTSLAASCLALEKTKKSVRGMYSPRDKEIVVCDIHNAAKIECHARHAKYCPQCVNYCTECGADCQQCEVTCPICFDVHPANEEVALICNHIFGKTCIQEWEQQQHGQKTCPICRDPLKYKVSHTCDLCNEPIRVREKSAGYTCTFEEGQGFTLTQVQESHTFHKRCITQFAIKSAYWHSHKEELLFFCPILHKHSCNRATLYFQVPLNKVALPMEYAGKSFKRKYQIEQATVPLCEICHTEIYNSKKTYTCKYATHNGWFGKSEKEHQFHDECLKGYVERTAYVHTNGKTVFNCPCNHEEVYEPNDFRVLVPHGYKPESLNHICCICKDSIKIEDSDTIPLVTSDEIRHCHNKCFNTYIAENAKEYQRRKDNKPIFTFPCPTHKDTFHSHDFILPDCYAVIVEVK